MSHKDTSFRAEQTDDTNYEAWLRQHALADKAEVNNETKLMNSESATVTQTTPSTLSVIEDDTTLPTDLPEDYQSTKPTYSFGLAKLVLVLLPLLFLAGYYTYTSVSGATFFGKTLSNNVNLENGLVGHWTFDGPNISTSTVFDVSGNGNNGSLFNGPKPAIGKVGQGLSFNISSTNEGKKVNLGSPSILDNLSNRSVSMWINFASGGQSTQNLISKLQWRIYKTLTKIYFYQEFSGEVGQWYSGNVSVGKWMHVVILYSDSSPDNDPFIYINGVAATTTEVYAPTGTVSDDGSSTIYLGGDTNTPGTQNLFGTLDDVRIYNRILSAKEVDALYSLGEGSKINVTQTPDNLQTGMVGHWTFDGPDMNWASTTAEATDRSGNNYHGNAVNIGQSNATQGKAGQGLKLNRSNSSYVSVNSSFGLSNTNLSLTGWVHRSQLGDHGAFFKIGNANDVSGGDGFAIGIGGAGVVGFETAGNNILALYEGIRWIDTGIQAKTGWHHYALVINSSGKPTIYWDGVSIFSDSGTNASPIGSIGTSITQIGGYQSSVPSNRYFTGTMDDVRVYNRALSVTEVAQLYSLGSGSTIKICKEASVQDADGGTYNTLAIGSQCWLDRNMNVGTRINAPTAQTNNSTIEKYCYDNTIANCTTNNPNKPDGGLYQWNEAMQYSTTEGARGICPVGFHIPTDGEWHTLEKFLLDGGAPCSSTRLGYGCAPAAFKLQPSGSSGFEFNVTGGFFPSFFGDRNGGGFLWLSSESVVSALSRDYFLGDAEVLRNVNAKTNGFSVRCLQD